MPTIRVNDAELYYEDTGSGEDAVLFAPGLAWGTLIFKRQVAALRERYRCVVVVPRGQRHSEVTSAGYELDQIAADLADVIEHLGLTPCHLVGHSLGGSAAVRVAVREPGLVRSLALLNATADEDPLFQRVLFKLLSYSVQRFGMGMVDQRLVKTYFGRSFRNDPAHAGEIEEARRQFLASDKVGIARAVRGWLRSPPALDELPKVVAPTLVIAGDEDATVKPERSRQLAERVANGRFLLLPRCGHSAPFEAPEAVNVALRDLFEQAVREPAVGRPTV
jgi:pimeloyl-ACP methyl ester carboxylesterase